MVVRSPKENSRTGAKCTVALVEAWPCFLAFHWTCVALCFTEGLPFVPKTVLGVCAKETDQSGGWQRVSRKESNGRPDRDVRDDSRTNPVIPRKSPKAMTQTPHISEISPRMVSSPSHRKLTHSSVAFRLTRAWVGYLPGGIPTPPRVGNKTKKPQVSS